MTYLKASHFNWVQLVKSSNMPWQSKYICFYLSTFMNAEQDITWPSLEQMEHETGLKRSQLIKSLEIAQAHEFIEKGEPWND